MTGTDADSISFQQMIACDTKNLGCDGGNILYATGYVWENNDFGNGNYGGLTSFAEYPFENFLGQDSPTCNAQGKTPRVYLNYPKIVTSINDRSSFEERRNLVMSAVSQQPITITMKSECDIMSLYKGGVLTSDSGCECCDSKCIDHAVVIVGYDTTATIPYWKIRNSWGPNFGESGHFRVAMNNAGCGWGLFGILAESALMVNNNICFIDYLMGLSFHKHLFLNPLGRCLFYIGGIATETKLVGKSRGFSEDTGDCW